MTSKTSLKNTDEEDFYHWLGAEAWKGRMAWRKSNFPNDPCFSQPLADKKYAFNETIIEFGD